MFWLLIAIVVLVSIWVAVRALRSAKAPVLPPEEKSAPGVLYAKQERRLFAPKEVDADRTIREAVRRGDRDAVSAADLLTFASRSAAFGRIDDARAAVELIDREQVDDSEVERVLAYIQYAAKEADLREEHGFDAVPGGFVQRGHSPYNPTHDLAKLILGLAEILEHDAYAVEIITIADTWTCAGEEARGGASLYANLREPSGEEQEDEQILTAWLVEMPDPGRAHQLVETAREVAQLDTATLTAVHGNLFCLLIQESARVGEEPLETDQSLTRFAHPIATLLA